MPIPRIAIVGRPNVGKSSLLNMLAAEKVSIVDDMPGVTRDRVSVIVELAPPAELFTPGEPEPKAKPAEFVDTGGFGVYVAEGARYDDAGKDLAKLTDSIEWQIGEAVGDADLILFCVDSQAGLTPRDYEIAKLLRERKYARDHHHDSERTPTEDVPIQVVATKVDGPSWEAHGFEFAALGFGEPLLCSAKNNYFRRELVDRLWEMVPETIDRQRTLADMRLAIVGKRNAGKSTLVNNLAGENRVIVSEIAGTTRDAIDVAFDMDCSDGKTRRFVAIDTAGLRRKKSFSGRVEWFALDRVERSLARADAALLMIDATGPISQVDELLGDLVRDAYVPVVIVVNKWDMVDGKTDDKGRPITTQHYEAWIRDQLKGLSFAPIAFMSAEEDINVGPVIELAHEMFKQASERVSTGVLNRTVGRILEKRGPSNKLGTRARVYYVSQVRTNPPTIVLIVNRKDLFKPEYMRYLMNRFRETLPFDEVPIRILLKERSQTRGERVKGVDGDHVLIAGGAGGDHTAKAIEIDLSSDLSEEELAALFQDDISFDPGEGLEFDTEDDER